MAIQQGLNLPTRGEAFDKILSLLNSRGFHTLEDSVLRLERAVQDFEERFGTNQLAETSVSLILGRLEAWRSLFEDVETDRPETRWRLGVELSSAEATLRNRQSAEAALDELKHLFRFSPTEFVEYDIRAEFNHRIGSHLYPSNFDALLTSPLVRGVALASTLLALLLVYDAAKRSGDLPADVILSVGKAWILILVASVFIHAVCILYNMDSWRSHLMRVLTYAYTRAISQYLSGHVR